MAKAKRSDEWDRAAPIIVILANAYRNPKKTSPFRYEDIHPFWRATPRELPGTPIRKSNIRLLKVFLHRGRN